MEILRNITYDEEEKSEVGIGRMLAEGYFSDAYPLHDVSNTPIHVVLSL